MSSLIQRVDPHLTPQVIENDYDLVDPFIDDPSSHPPLREFGLVTDWDMVGWARDRG
jgi:hypothetical protein